MASLSAHARSLLHELAKDNGVGALDFDADGLIPMTIRDTLVAIAYSPANDSFFLVAALRAPGEAGSLDPWPAFELSGRLAARRTRVSVEPGSKALMLVREILLEGLAYWQFRDTVEEFLRDVGEAKSGDPSPAAAADTLSPLSAGDLMLIRI